MISLNSHGTIDKEEIIAEKNIQLPWQRQQRIYKMEKIEQLQRSMLASSVSQKFLIEVALEAGKITAEREKLLLPYYMVFLFDKWCGS